MVILGAPELAAQVTTEQAFPKDPVVNEFLSPFLGKSSIISVNGAKWKALHSIFAPAFSPAYVRTLTDDKQEDIVGDRDFMEMAISNIKSFLAAGHETTAHTLGYIFMLLSKHPDALQKARLEHDQVFDPDFKRTVELIRAHPERLYDLHYTTGIIKESLRLFPIGSAARTSAKGLHVMYEGKKLPLTDQIILVCNMIIHYNPEIFPSPGDFQPERFTTQIVPKDAWRPFERGLRGCIGQDLAMMEMRMVLLIVLRSFDFETLGTNERKYPAATYTNLHTIFGDLVYQRQSLTARPLGNQDMKVKFARDMRNS
ncbi:hypothetical protein PABG_05074 [Paracoccidioides brasiliensis Pb03]|nr:hypothetical protein PABG_05074 [Paracoccidioides brasiliensis Pb03]